MAVDSPAPAHSVTKSVSIDCAPDDVFDFIADAGNWPRSAIVNVQSVRRGADPEWWEMQTPRGPGRLRILGDRASGILDHQFENQEAHWTVPARVVQNGRGAEFMMTFFQPRAFSDDFFTQQIALVDIELNELKKILESSSRPSPAT